MSQQPEPSGFPLAIDPQLLPAPPQLSYDVRERYRYRPISDRTLYWDRERATYSSPWEQEVPKVVKATAAPSQPSTSFTTTHCPNEIVDLTLKASTPPEEVIDLTAPGGDEIITTLPPLPPIAPDEVIDLTESPVKATFGSESNTVNLISPVKAQFDTSQAEPLAITPPTTPKKSDPSEVTNSPSPVHNPQPFTDTPPTSPESLESSTPEEVTKSCDCNTGDKFSTVWGKCENCLAKTTMAGHSSPAHNKPGMARSFKQSSPLQNKPGSGRSSKPSSPLINKPGSIRSFKPLNTLIDKPRISSTHKTYSTRTKRTHADDQLDFLENEKVGQSEQVEQDAEANKRLKLRPSPKTTITPIGRVDLESEDDQMSRQPSKTTVTPIGAVDIESEDDQVSRQPPKTTVIDVESEDDVIYLSHEPSQELPANGFKETSILADPHRKKGRKSSNVAASVDSDVQMIQSPARSSTKGPVQKPTTSNDLGMSSSDELHPETVSKHFTSSRINASTESRKASSTVSQPTNKVPKPNLRDAFRPSNAKDDEDELSKGPIPKSRNGRSGPPAKKFDPRKRWPLLSARSYDIKYEEQEPGVLLLVQTDATEYTIGRADIEPENAKARRDLDPAQIEVLHIIDIRKVTRAQTDSHQRVRLEGPRPPTGDKLYFDLEFANDGDARLFVPQGVSGVDQVSRKAFKGPEYMEELFKKPLRKTDTTDDSEMALIEKRVQSKAENTTPEQLAPRSMRNSNPAPQDAASQEIIVQTPSALGRVRSTRSSNSSGRDAAIQAGPLDEEPIRYSVVHGLGPVWRHAVLYNSGPRRRAQVNFTDLENLDDGEYLNDNLVDFYMMYMFDLAKLPDKKVYFFNSFFYKTLTKPVPGQRGAAINYAGVARWTAKDNIFDYDYIVVPICEDNHWYLAIICNVSQISRLPNFDQSEPSSLPPSSDGPGDAVALYSRKDRETLDLAAAEDPDLFEEEQRLQSEPNADNTISDLDESISKGIIADTDPSPTKTPAKTPAVKRKMKFYNLDTPIIIVLDSLGSPHPRAVRALKDYILAEGQAKFSVDASIHSNAFYPKEMHIPTQDNWVDCGLYLLGYVQKFFRNPKNFVDRLLSREMDAKTDWPDMDPSKMRATMRETLQKLHHDQEQERRSKRIKKKDSSKTVEPATREKPEEILSDSQALFEPDVEKTETAETVPQRTNTEPDEHEIFGAVQAMFEEPKPDADDYVADVQKMFEEPPAAEKADTANTSSATSTSKRTRETDDLLAEPPKRNKLHSATPAYPHPPFTLKRFCRDEDVDDVNPRDPKRVVIEEQVVEKLGEDLMARTDEEDDTL